LEKSRKEQEILLSELRAAQNDLQHAVRMRDDFMSIVSHELRTPLNGLVLETQLRKLRLNKGDTSAFTPDKLKAMTERDERQINSLVRLIEDMLDVSRIRTGKLSIRPTRFDLAALVGRVLENYSAQIAAAGCEVTLSAAEPVTGLWDEFRIEQVVVNLLTNALRYGAKKPVDLRVRATPEGACIEVQDHGIGISVPDLARIFQQFERVSSNEVTQGLGLGLYITEQIVASHQGTIEVESHPGQGSLFRVYLPLESRSVDAG
jgi:signal transduction histidine kinase